MAHYSQFLTNQIVREEDLNVPLSKNILRLFSDADAWKKDTHLSSKHDRILLNADHKIIFGHELDKKVTELVIDQSKKAIAGAIISRTDQTFNTRGLMNSLIDKLDNKYKVDFRWDTKIIELLSDKGNKVCAVLTEKGEMIKADQIVLCNGIDCINLLSPFNLKSIMRLQIGTIQSHCTELTVDRVHPYAIVFPETHTLLTTEQRDDGTILKVQHDQQLLSRTEMIDSGSKAKLISSMLHLYPHLSHTMLPSSLFQSFQRVLTTDDLPLVGRVPELQNVYLNTAGGVHTTSLAAASGKLIQESIDLSPGILDPTHFAIGRFAYKNDEVKRQCATNQLVIKVGE